MTGPSQIFCSEGLHPSMEAVMCSKSDLKVRQKMNPRRGFPLKLPIIQGGRKTHFVSIWGRAKASLVFLEKPSLFRERVCH